MKRFLPLIHHQTLFNDIPKKVCAHEVLGRPLAFGRADLSFVWKEVTKFEEP